jgi:lipopolysaccharide/colanic/teichoic acid biosynthesis glycosyltransferase
MRILDIVGSVALMVLLAPLFTIAAVRILWDDGRPILFRQKRIGRNGKPFLIVKFRTMRRDHSGASITARGDTRVTRAGAWLRRHKLDELPQLINVLRGEMSLIGPRPEIPKYVALQDNVWRTVLEVRPGITDLATLVFRDEEEALSVADDPEAYYRLVILPEKLRLNLRYLRSRSARSDLRLLWMTARYSFFPNGFNRDRVVRWIGA